MGMTKSVSDRAAFDGATSAGRASASAGNGWNPVSWQGTPFAARTASLNQNALWMLWDRMMITDLFSSLETELNAVRTSVAVGDMSPLSKHEIRGPEALDVVNRVITRDARRLEVGQTYYTPWCDERGKLVNDGLVIRVDETTFRLSADPNMGWLTQCAAGRDADVVDVTADYAILTLQGPKSTEVLAAATDSTWTDLRFSRLRRTTIAGRPVEVLRQGFTGEVGYELWIPAADAVPVWDAVLGAGALYGVRPAGALTEDVARVEAGLLIVGYDYASAGPDSHGAAVQVRVRHEASPFELGMGNFVDFRKPEFIGKDALVREVEEGSRTQLVGLEIDWREILRAYELRGAPPAEFGRVMWHPVPLAGDGDENRRASSVTWSPTAKKLVGFGHVSPSEAKLGNVVSLLWPVAGEGVEIPAVVIDLPFVSRRRSTSLS